MAGDPSAAVAPRRWTMRDRVVAACCIAWVVPAVVALLRRIASGWYPVGDKAAIAVGGGDVLTEHHRLLGTGSSASFQSVLANHPGPLLFDVVALPIRLFGTATGLSIGIAALNIGAGLVAIVAATRQAGRAAALATTAGLCLLTWSAGNDVLVEAYNPTAAMVPFFAVLVLAWAAANGDRWSLPWLIGFGSFCVQANVAYIVTTVPIVAAAIGVFLWRRRGRRPVRDVLVWCLPVLLVLWSQPLIEQIINGRTGNLARLARNTTNLEAPLGTAEGTRHAAAVLSQWPAWTRGRFDGGYATSLFAPPPPVALAALSLVGLVALLVVLAFVSRRWLADRATATLCAAAAVFVLVGWVATARVPLSPFYGFLAHFVRWLWPIGVLTVVAVGLAVTRVVQRWLARARQPFVVAATRARPVIAGVALIAAVVVALPDGAIPIGGEWDRASPTAKALNALAVERLPASGVVVDFRPPEYSMYAFSLTAGLQDHGTPFSVTDSISVRQYGDGRLVDPDRGWPVVYAVSGFDALTAWDDAVACASSLDETARVRLLAARDALIDGLSAPGFTLSADGARFATSAFATPWMAEVPDGLTTDVETVVDSTEFASLLEGGVMIPPAPLAQDGRDFVELGRRLDEKAACVLMQAA